VAGIGRIDNTQSLIHNGLIPPLLGRADFPHRDTLRTFLWHFRPEHLQPGSSPRPRPRHALPTLGAALRCHRGCRTTALITYGHQEGVALGYIPKRRHRQGSYAPILASEGHTGLSLAAELRAGNVHAVTGTWPFLEAQLDKLPSTVAASRPRVRLDGAFYDQDIIHPLNGTRVGDCIVARMTQPLKDRMVTAKYHEFREGWEAVEFPYTPFHWQQTHRFVAVRRPIAHEPLERQPHLFTFKRSTDHRALVTNLTLTSEAVYRSTATAPSRSCSCASARGRTP